MQVKDIITEVRYILDEETGYEDYETVRMDNIIRSRASDALRWLLLYGNGSLLNGADGGSGYVVHKDKETVIGGFVTLPSEFVKLIRVRGEGWSRAVMTPISEDSEEYLMQSDPTAKADKTRPMAALIESSPNKLELFPHETTSCSLTYVTYPTEASGEVTSVSIPPKARTAYLYYLAYLVMVAYGDSGKAQLMLGTAKMNAGIVNS